ncbi:MAG TPA: hypothetical protein VNO33_23990, partial [Kofleriaceae bacterium]|nr:hypothetical protein [Kofleriaceae bacterium]
MSRAEPHAEQETDRPGPDGLPRAEIRRARDSIIKPRPRARRAHRVLLSLAFALAGTPILMASGWVTKSAEFRTGEPAPVSVRVPLFLGPSVDHPGQRAAMAAVRGQPVEDAARIEQVRQQQPTGWGAGATYMAALFLIGLLYTEQLGRSHKGRLLRVQAALLGLQLGLALVMAAALLMTPIPAVAIPAAILVISTAVVVDVGAALATAVVAALLLGGLTPFDPGVITVLAVQGACAALFLGDRPLRRVSRLRLLAAGAVGGGAAALSYTLIYYLSWKQAPV